MIVKYPFLLAATRLRQEEPLLWTEFITTLQKHATDLAFDLVRASPEQLLLVQGRVQGVMTLVDDLTDAHNRVAKQEEKKK